MRTGRDAHQGMSLNRTFYGIETYCATTYDLDGCKVLIVPFMELKRASALSVISPASVLIVPFMELKLSR